VNGLGTYAGSISLNPNAAGPNTPSGPPVPGSSTTPLSTASVYTFSITLVAALAFLLF